MKRGAHRTRGQSLVEMALITPLLVFFLFGITDIGRGYYQYTVMTQAVREATRYAAVTWSNSVGGAAATNSNAGSAPFGTVQGRMQFVGQTAGMTFANDAAHLSVTYYDGTSSAPTQCAHWDAASNAVVLDNSYGAIHPRTGDLVKVHLMYTFRPIVPILSQITGAAFDLTADQNSESNKNGATHVIAPVYSLVAASSRRWERDTCGCKASGKLRAV